MEKKQLDRLFNPKTIAVIGASNSIGSVGYALMKNLVGSKFEGIVYPINPKRQSIQGVKAYPHVSSAPDRIDLAIIATPAKSVLKIVEECGTAKVGNIVIVSSGFNEIGKAGEDLTAGILKISKKHGMRIMGPNCLGFINPKKGLNASFAKNTALPGKIAFISQSGALGTAVLDWAVKQNVGFSHFVSIGSMADIGFNDLIDYFGRDPGTSSILIYMESLSNARKFLSAARAFARTKPILVLKVGKSDEGAKAARSHTGTITGNDSVFDAAFKRAGIIRVNTINELFNCAQTLAMQPRPLGKRLSIVTNAGGPGVIATDALISLSGELASLSPNSMKLLNKKMPSNWSKGNPVDVLGDAPPERYRDAVEICMKDVGCDGILVILTPQAMTKASEIAKCLVELKGSKPVLAVWMGNGEVEAGKEILKKNKIPVYSTPEDAVNCFMSMYSYSKNLELLYETPATIPHAFKPKTIENRKLIEKIAGQKRSVLTEVECMELLSNYGIPTVECKTAKTAGQAEKIALEIGLPVAAKILSADILHKTDVGGVALNLNSQKEVRNAFQSIMASVGRKAPKAKILGICISKMESKKYELLIGCKKDRIFGPAIVFGMGGVAVEIYKDTNIGLPPLNMALAKRLIEETKIYRLLKGYRGMEGVDLDSIKFLLYKFAYLVTDFPELKEIDINPFAVDKDGGVVLDAKVVLDKSVVGKKTQPYAHMVISPYPKEYVTKFRMKNGKTAVLRPIKPEDEPLEAEMFKTFSEQTQRFRFFGLIKDITHELLIRYTQIDYDREIAIIAEIDEGGKKKMAGVVRLIADSFNETAEFAIVVGDPWQKQGLGDKFTDYILKIAKKRNLKKVYANVLKNNHIMLHMFQQRGFAITREKDSCYAELEL